jgi:hypothetical protein
MDVELTEAWLSEETGVPRERLREIREKNLSAADWRKGTRGQIVWELTGLDRASVEIIEFAGIIEKITGGPEGARRALAGVTVLEARVVRKFGNPQLIEARGQSGELFRVKVHSSKNFTAGMCIKVRPPKVLGSPWVLVGRSPRWPGRF